MNYQIISTIFTIKDQNLSINGEAIDLKSASFQTLQLLLKSQGDVISKDDLLNHVWKDVIVSDSSVFKQIEIIRKLFFKAGLPKDTIENIYGKGYKIKYEIIQTPESSTLEKVKNQPIKSTKTMAISLFLIILIVAALLFIYSKYLNNSNQSNYLNKSKRQSMIELMTNNWEEGMDIIVRSINQDKSHLSIDDLAFLYGKKGKAHYHLQEYDKSLESYNLALKYFLRVDDKKNAGQVHLDMATSLNMLPQNSQSFDSQKNHIDTAIGFFQQSESPIQMIDAQMVLAHLYQKNNKVDEAILLFEKTITDAISINDDTGAMMANNNLAAAHLILNHNDKALQLGQKGLDMALKIGNGRHIANSYSFLSGLYQNQYRSIEAMQMIQQAIKHQLANKEFSYISPKLTTLNYLLVQTYQFDKAEELLELAGKYAESLKVKNGVSILLLYKGLNAARQYNWQEAEESLKKGLKISQSINFKYKQPLNKAYLSLAYYFNQNSLQAIEQATEVFNSDGSDDQSKAIAALTLAYSYSSIEKTELANQWFQKVQQLQNKKWLFEYQLFLTLKLERQNDSILAVQTQKEIQEVKLQMLDLSQSAQVDEVIYQDLVSQISKKISN
ncbi:MAG: winged helix-turn-helix domain-containing protein [Marinicellaceae bacterium]